MTFHQGALALISGVLLTLSFPKFGHPMLGWVALVPTLVALVQGGGKTSCRTGYAIGRAWWLGLVTGGVYFGGTLYWITDVMVTFGEVSLVIGVILNALLVAYLALFPVLCIVLVGWFIHVLGLYGLILFPPVWVATELARAHFFGGFPWVLLGYSQATVLPVAQLASVFGVYGLSAAVALVNASLVYAIYGVRWRRVAPLTLALVSVFGVAAWGEHRMASKALLANGSPIRVALVQGNISQNDKWNLNMRESILDTYLVMTRAAAKHDPQLIVWPESSTPFAFEEDDSGAAAVRDVVRETGIPILLGSDQLEIASKVKYYNAAFLLGPGGETEAVYRKIHLVPFGEFVPFRKLLFFVEPLVEGVADFSAGSVPITLPIGGHLISTAICYEIVYPGLIREFVLAGSELLTTITNDAWYGTSSAPYQHFEQASMRAIEQGRYLVRAANTGISGIVNPYGQVESRTRIFERDTVIGDVMLLSDMTVYGIIGDSFAYLCSVITFLALVTALVYGRYESKILTDA